MTISTAYPDILQNGTPADATQVMADFYQIQNDVNANAAHNGANSDITSLTGLTTPLAPAYGGTGATTLSGAGILTTASTSIPAGDIPIFTGTGVVVQDSGTLLSALAQLASPAFSGVPTTPTAASGTNTTQVASTAFVTGAITGLTLKTQVFTSSGTYTPTTNMLYCAAELQGGGNGSGDNSGGNSGGGGGGGTYARKILSAATIGASQAVTVGSASGGTTSLGALVSAPGGGAGLNTGAGGAGGTAATGADFYVLGQPGGHGASGYSYGGGGGDSYFGRGGMPVTTSGTAGNPGIGYGAGASGASGAIGAAGTTGIVVITELIGI